jgi:hypothetical protein
MDGDGKIKENNNQVLFGDLTTSLDPSDIDYLGAEIEIEMGKEHEKYVFDKPTVVIIPEGMPHNPIVTKRVDKPYAVFLISLGAEHETSSVD